MFRVSMNNELVQNQKKDPTSGHILFDWSTYTYDLLFTFSYDTNGKPQPCKAECKRYPIGKPTAANKDPFYATQIIIDPKVDFSQGITATQASLMMTGLGLFLSVLFYAIDKARECKRNKGDAEKEEKLNEQFEDLHKVIQKGLDNLKTLTDKLVERNPPVVDLRDCRPDVENGMRSAMVADMRLQPDADRSRLDRIADAASNRVAPLSLENAVRARGQEQILEALNPIRNLLSPESRSAAVQMAVLRVVQGNELHENPAASSFSQGVRDSQVARFQMQQNQSAVDAAREQESQLAESLKEKQADAQQHRINWWLEHPDSPKSDADNDPAVQEADREVAEEDKKHQAADDAVRWHEQAQDDAQEGLEQRDKDGAEQADASADAAFERGEAHGK